MRSWRETNPVKAAYIALRSNAKRRGKRFVLTLPEFVIFCAETDYLKLRGMEADSMTIDCIYDDIGYAKGNIQMLSRKENARKGRSRSKAPYKPDGVPF